METVMPVHHFFKGTDKFKYLIHSMEQSFLRS